MGQPGGAEVVGQVLGSTPAVVAVDQRGHQRPLLGRPVRHRGAQRPRARPRRRATRLAGGRPGLRRAAREQHRGQVGVRAAGRAARWPAPAAPSRDAAPAVVGEHQHRRGQLVRRARARSPGAPSSRHQHLVAEPARRPAAGPRSPWPPRRTTAPSPRQGRHRVVGDLLAGGPRPPSPAPRAPAAAPPRSARASPAPAGAGRARRTRPAPRPSSSASSDRPASRSPAMPPSQPGSPSAGIRRSGRLPRCCSGTPPRVVEARHRRQTVTCGASLPRVASPMPSTSSSSSTGGEPAVLRRARR